MKVETEELLSIGRFARMSGLTVKALRHYAEQGLLEPAHVDEWTGYRYYTANQAPDAIAIRRLRQLELPLDEIARVLRSEDETVLRERLAVHRARLEGRAVEVAQILGQLDRLIEGKEPLVPQITLDVQLEDVPELRVAAITGHVRVDDMFTFVPETVERVCAWLARRGAQPAGPSLTLHHGIENDALDVEVGLVVADGVSGDGEVSIREYPAVRAAVHVHRGGYEALPTIFEPLRGWIVEHGLTPAAPIREIYERNPSDTTDESEFVTRLCWPVA